QVSAWINLRQAGRVIQTRLEDRLQKEADLSWAEFELLMRLRVSAAHPLQMSEIAAQLVGSPSGTTRIADRLVRDGLIVRETPRENRRIVRVQLTDHGREVLSKADEVIKTNVQEVLGDHLTETEVTELRAQRYQEPAWQVVQRGHPNLRTQRQVRLAEGAAVPPPCGDHHQQPKHL